jgi:hypothetical protein
MVYNTITGFSGLCPSSGILETRKHNVSEAGYASALRFTKGPNKVRVPPPSPEDGNRSTFRNTVFASF